MTVAFTDLLLCATCASATAVLLRQPNAIRRYGALGMALMALASGLGALRFAGLEWLARAHTSASHLAGAVAPACFALVAVLLVARGRRWIADVGLGALFAGWAVFVVLLKLSVYRTALGTLAIFLLCAVALRDRSGASGLLALGGLGIGVAGIAIGTEGTVGPVLAINLFHLVLALSHALVAVGLATLASGD
jgi:hypothetical protein